MIGHYLVDYVVDDDRTMPGPGRVLPFDQATPAIEAAGGYWSEAEVDGDRAIVRCRAPENLLRELATSYRRIDDPAAHWTPTRAGLEQRRGEIASRPDVRHRNRRLASLEADVLDDAGADALRRRVDRLTARADREGHVLLRDLPWHEAVRVLCMAARRGYGLDRISTGTFPTTGVLDNFNRAAIGTNWTTWAGVALSIASSTLLAASATNGEGYWNVDTYGPDAEVYLDFSTMPPANTFIAMHLRISSPGASNNSYELNYKAVTGAANDTQQMARYAAGVSTNIGAANTLEFAAGDGYGFEAFGSTLTAYRRASGTWSAAFSRTDTNLLQAGYLSAYIQSTTTRLDNFGGGSLVKPQHPPVVVSAQTLSRAAVR